ncbi:unnamed protein product [Amaranthus hypochondriacus]
MPFLKPHTAIEFFFSLFLNSFNYYSGEEIHTLIHSRRSCFLFHFNFIQHGCYLSDHNGIKVNNTKLKMSSAQVMSKPAVLSRKKGFGSWRKRNIGV